MKPIYKRAALALLLGASPLVGLAAEAPAEQPPAALEKAAVQAEEKAVPAVSAKAPDKGKQAAAAKKDTEKKEAPEPLMAVDGENLSDADFTINTFALGGDVKALITKGGQPQAIVHHGLTDTYTWEGMVVTSYNPFMAKYMNRSDLPLETKVPAFGISSFLLTGKDYVTSRGIHAGSRRENVLRRYGRPSEVLWDGEKNCFYLVYQKDKKELTFTVEKDKVSSIRIAWAGKPIREEQVKNGLPEKDFHLAGFTLHEGFVPHGFQDWEKKMENPKETIWYYPGYAVRVTTKEQLIGAIFLTDNQMLTSRGLAMGDAPSTLDLLYGPPQKVESDAHESSPRTTYVYFSKDKSQVFLAYLKDQKVDGIIVADNPQKGKSL